VRRRKLPASLLSNSHVFGKSVDLRQFSLSLSLSLAFSLTIFARASFSFFICVSRGDCFTLRAFCTRGPFSGSRDAQRTELHRTASEKKPGLMSMSAIPVMFCKLRDDLRRAVAFGSHLTFSQYATVRWSIGEIGISHNLSLISDKYKYERMIFVLLSSQGSRRSYNGKTGLRQRNRCGKIKELVSSVPRNHKYRTCNETRM